MMSPYSSPLASVCHEPSPTLQQRLQIVAGSRPELWVYCIFWQASNNSNGDLVLSWADGHFRGHRTGSEMEVDRLMDGHPSEWFYSASFSRSFLGSGDVVSQAFVSGSVFWLTSENQNQNQNYEFERFREARMSGIQTLVCISTSVGVLEMGSADLIDEDWEIIQFGKSLFGSDISSNISSVDLGLFSGSQREWSSFQEKPYPQKTAKTEAFIGDGGLSSKFSRSDSDGNSASAYLSNNQTKRRRRKLATENEAAVNRVQAEKHRREKMNRRFYALRSAVPNVSKMDKASLLADAVDYINKLKAEVEEMELQLRSQSTINTKMSVPTASTASKSIFRVGDKISKNVFDDFYKIQPPSMTNCLEAIDVDVKIVGTEALIRAHGRDKGHPSARLMNVLRELDLQIHHASISKAKELILQDVVVRLPDGLNNEKAVKIAIHQRLNY